MIGNVLTNGSRLGTIPGMPHPPRAIDLMWPDPELGPWRVHVWWRVQQGVPTPVGLEIRGWITEDEYKSSGPHNRLPLPSEDAVFPRIDGQLMRSFQMGALLDESRRLMVQHLQADRDETGWPEGWKTSYADWRASVAEERTALEGTRRGRDLGPDHYREVADVYAAAVQDGCPPTAAVADHFTVSKSAAAKKVARARQRGFLPATSKGRIGPLTEEPS